MAELLKRSDKADWFGSPAETNVFLRLIGRVIQLVDTDAEFRSDLSILVESARHACRAGTLTSAVDTAASIVEPDEQLKDDSFDTTPEDQRPTVVDMVDGEVSADVLEKRGDNAEHQTYRPQWIPTTDNDLPTIEQRCRLKSEATLWALARKQATTNGADFKTEIVPTNRTFFDRANEIGDCFLWMLHPNWRMSDDHESMEHVGDCFGVLADALSLVQVTLKECPSTDFFRQSLLLLAEAQSTLRIAVEPVNDRGDSDQAATFAWLRCTTSERQIHIPTCMRLDDLSDPANIQSLLLRINTLTTEVDNSLKITREKTRLFGKMHHLLDQLVHRSGDRSQHWSTLICTIDELVTTGVPPSNKQIREALLPVISQLPTTTASLPDGFARVLRELGRFSTRRNAISDVKQVRGLIKNTAVLLIGGYSRLRARKRLARAFKLERLDWISVAEHESIEQVRAAVSKPDVAIVLLASRLPISSLRRVLEMCEKHEKLLVEVHAGHNLNEVASRILQECGNRLKLTVNE